MGVLLVLIPPLEPQLHKPVEHTIIDALRKNEYGYYWLTEARIKRTYNRPIGIHNIMWQFYIDGGGKQDQERFVARHDLKRYWRYFVLPELRTVTGRLKKQLKVLPARVLAKAKVHAPHTYMNGWYGWYLATDV